MVIAIETLQEMHYQFLLNIESPAWNQIPYRVIATKRSFRSIAVSRMRCVPMSAT